MTAVIEHVPGQAELPLEWHDPIVITRAKAMELLEAVVAEAGPDYRYPMVVDGVVLNEDEEETEFPDGCLYTRDGKPDCMIARALFKAGVPIQTLQGMEMTINAEYGQNQELRQLVELTPTAVRLFDAAQRAQDRREVWADVLRGVQATYAD